MVRSRIGLLLGVLVVMRSKRESIGVSEYYISEGVRGVGICIRFGFFMLRPSQL